MKQHILTKNGVLMNKIDELFSPIGEIIAGNPDTPAGVIFKDCNTGLTVHRVILNAGLGGDEKNILLFADTHFACLNERDFAENNPLVIESYNRRKVHFKIEKCCDNVAKIMRFAPSFDKTALLGDSMDFLSYGGLEMLSRCVLGDYPDTLVLVGNHDDTRIAGHKGVDPTDRASREQILAGAIKNDIFYHSEMLSDKLMLIGLNNCHRRYTEYQRERLERDIQAAREQGIKIIISQHEMINTGREEDARLPSMYMNSEWCYKSAYNFYNGNDKIGAQRDNECTNAVYELICSSADVISAIFAGHWHNAAYSEINASYLKDGEAIKAVIPQYVVASAAYDDGFMTVLTVK